MNSVKLKKLHPEAVIPKRGTSLSSGFDLCALDVVADFANVKNIPYEDYIVHHGGYMLYPGERVLIRTGIAVQMFAGIEAQIRPRSGLALKDGIYVALGTIDADYTGDLGVIMTNNGDYPFTINRGDRIAQLVFAPVLHDLEMVKVDDFESTERGSGGFGHTGLA